MHTSNDICPQNYEVLEAFSNCDLHSYVYKKKNLLEVGTLQILGQKNHAETPSQNSLCLRIKKTAELIKPAQTLVRLPYPQTTSFLFENKQNSISVISFHNDNGGQREKFEQLIKKTAAIQDLNSELLEERLKLKIEQSCPQNIQEEEISSDPRGNVKNAGKIVGGFFGAINKIVKPSSDSVGRVVSQRADRFSQGSLSEETRTKWKTLKQKTSNINQKVSNFVKPVVKGYYHVTEKIGQSFNNSQNSVIKALRQYSIAFASSMNQAQKKARTPELATDQKVQEKVQEIKQEVTEAQIKNIQAKHEQE